MNKLEKLMKLLNQERKGTYVEKLPQDVYRDVAEQFDQFEPNDIAKIGGVESQHGKYSKPLQGGSARGIFQFQPETAEYLIPGSSNTLGDMNTQAELMKEYLRRNKQDKIEDAYMLHQLGPTRGRKLRDADGEDNIKSVIPKRVIKANPSLYDGDTVEDARKTIRDKLDLAGESIEFVKDPLAELIKFDISREPTGKFEKLKNMKKRKMK